MTLSFGVGVCMPCYKLLVVVRRFVCVANCFIRPHALTCVWSRRLFDSNT